MRQVTVVCIGKLQEKWLQEGCKGYEKRLGLWCKPNTIELSEYKVPQNPTTGQMEAALEKEGQAILDKLPDKACVIALCVEGKTMSSPDFADYLQKAANGGCSHFVFVIGGSFGLWQPVKERADLRLSISPMTFPHQLARVLVWEQIYRGYSILNHGKYHK